MDTVRDGLRAGELKKDTFDRLICVSCDRTLKRRKNPDEMWAVRHCTECGSKWKEMR